MSKPNEVTQNELIVPRTYKRDTEIPKPDEPRKAADLEKMATKMTEKAVALTSLVPVEFDELGEKVKSMMEKTTSATPDGRRRVYVCKVCGKEGQSIHVQNHIEAKHLEGISLPCNVCGETSRSSTTNT